MRLDLAVTAVILFSCSIVPSLSCFSQGLTHAERPEVKVGDSWVFQTTDVRTGEKRPETIHTVSEVGPEKIVVTTEADTRTYTRDWNLIEIKTGNTVRAAAKPFWPNLQFPLEVGKKWEQRYESMTLGGQRTYSGERTLQVIGVETVTVPAGTFETFKVRQQGTYHGSSLTGNWSGTWIKTTWFSPAARREVKEEFEDSSRGYYNHQVWELRSLTLAQ